MTTSNRPQCWLPEMWAGVECTVNRVGDRYFDQVASTGHAGRLADLDRFAALGVSTLRYPVLWERTQPERDREPDWTWADERLAHLRALRMRPIVGLVHHGSGPAYASLADDAFAEGLAAYARAVAARYPWVDAYTPVNEPLTTARFSGLYGHWYPHGRDSLTFARVLLRECRAVALAMAAIRGVNATAALVQTEDLGKTFSTPALRYQADFDNERRWLAWDLLCGRVDRRHPLWGFLLSLGLAETELTWFLDHPCPPDIIGINHYVTSERFLDDEVDRYPPSTHGGNGRHRYADIEAVRVRAEGLAGVGTLIQEAWRRYRLPIAITEVHLGCTREEQMRWLLEVWDAACACKAAGIDVRALTAWSLLGAYDWDSLVTRAQGHYEPGVYDVRSPLPRPTGLAGMVRALAAGQRPAHPFLASPGWWRRSVRLTYPARRIERATTTRIRRSSVTTPAPILITGAAGMLAQAFTQDCRRRGLAFQALRRHQLDIVDRAAVEAALERFRPWAVINAAGSGPAPDAEVDPERCQRDNCAGAGIVAELCARHGVGLLALSSDLVFDDVRRVQHVESDTVAPRSLFGSSKAAAEARILETHPGALVIRSGPCFGSLDGRCFAAVILQVLAAGRRLFCANDNRVSATYLADLVHAALDLLIDGERGIWHLANDGPLTWAEIARHTARAAGFDPGAVIGCPAADLAGECPAHSALASERGQILPPLHSALSRYVPRCLNWTERPSCPGENRRGARPVFWAEYLAAPISVAPTGSA